MSKAPIGLFDSGIGGTSIWKAVTNQLPFENTIFLADSKNAPYGNKSKSAIIDLSIKNTEYLLEQNCKLIIVACNTATTNAIAYLRKHYKVPFIGIEPAIKPAALQTKTGVVGILATKGTLASELFHTTSNLHAGHIKVIEQIGEGLVDLIEAGKIHSEAMTNLLYSYLKPMITANIDYLVLGCTHYPYLIPQLREILPEHVTIIDSGLAVARQTHKILASQNELTTDVNVQHYLHTNGNVEVLKHFVTPNSITTVNYLDF